MISKKTDMQAPVDISRGRLPNLLTMKNEMITPKSSTRQTPIVIINSSPISKSCAMTARGTLSKSFRIGVSLTDITKNDLDTRNLLADEDTAYDK